MRRMFFYPLAISLISFSGSSTTLELPDSADDQNIYDIELGKVRIRIQPATPPYPIEAKSKKIDGLVIVEVTINKDGVPTAARAIQGPELLRKHSEDYAMTWRFHPTTLGKHPRNVRFKLPMPWRLPR